MRVGLIGLGRMGEGMSRRMLKQGIEEVCSDLGVETWDLPHLNSRDVFDKNRHYEEMYEGREDLIEAVRNWYGYEIVAFDYEFGTYL